MAKSQLIKKSNKIFTQKTIKKNKPNTESILKYARIKYENKLNKNIQILVKKFLQNSHSNKGQQCIISFLNSYQHRQVESIQHIPSIENMISQAQIKYDIDNRSDNSVSISQKSNFPQDNIDLLIDYFCIVQRVLKKIPYRITRKQNNIILKGLWNLTVKYWKDKDLFLYSQIDRNLEWGILQYLNYNFRVAIRQRFQAELKIINAQYILEKNHSQQ